MLHHAETLLNLLYDSRWFCESGSWVRQNSATSGFPRFPHSCLIIPSHATGPTGRFFSFDLTHRLRRGGEDGVGGKSKRTANTSVDSQIQRQTRQTDQTLPDDGRCVFHRTNKTGNLSSKNTFSNLQYSYLSLCCILLNLICFSIRNATSEGIQFKFHHLHDS